MRNFVLFSLLTMVSSLQSCVDGSPSYINIFHETQLEFGYNTGKFISIDKDYSEASIFVPMSLSNCYTPFLELHSYRFNDGKWAASTGVGIRKNLTEFSVLGINVYYDYLRGESKHNFHQIGLGLEWLNDCWDIRINGYLPVSQKTHKSAFTIFDQFDDGFFATRRKIEYAYSGFDAEIGVPLLRYCNFNLYGAAGPYYFLNFHQNHFVGGYGRLELDWNSVLSLQIRMSYDKVYSTNIQGIIQFSLPLDFFCSCSCSENCGCHCSINQQVRRKGIILTDHCCNWTWNWDD